MTKPTKSNTPQPRWLSSLLTTLLTGYFIFTMWTLYAIGKQANLMKLRVFLISLIGVFLLERLIYRGKEGAGNQSGGWLRFFIFFTWYALLATSLLVYLLHPLENFAWSAVGLAFIVLGLFMRLWGIRTLGRFFSTQVETWQGQTVVQDGPYRWIRHPAYLGSLMIGIGYPLLMSTWWVLGLSAAFIVVLLLRIREEEAYLKQQLPAYAKYCNHTKRLIPRVW